MFNVCASCGEYRPDKEIDPTGPYAVCPVCEYRHLFKYFPFLSLTGASGAGKTTLCRELVRRTKEIVVLESDILWREEFDDPNKGLEYRNLWLRVAKNISQAGRPVLLCGSATPGQFESCVEARYFSSIHYLALVCDENVLASRLRERPDWRASSRSTVVAAHQKWNRWFRETRHVYDVTLLDTTHVTIENAADEALSWVRGKTPSGWGSRRTDGRG